MVRLLLLIVLAFGLQEVNAQNLQIIVDVDTITSEKVFEVTYLLDESCRNNDLIFQDFTIVYGPNVSNSISIVNGKRTAETKFTFGLRAIEQGSFFLPNEVCGYIQEEAPMITVIDGYVTKEQRLEKIKSTRKIKKI